MAEIRITRDFRAEKWFSKIRFGDGKPVVVAYCRVSTEDQADEGYSLETQQSNDREACDRKLGKGKYHIIYILVDEHGPLPFNRGGMAKGTYREGLTLAVEIFRAGLAQFLCVYKMNRITRNLRIYLELDEDVLQPNNVEIFSATEPIGNRDSAGKFFTSIIGASAENEHANIVSVSKDGLRSRMEKGYFTGLVPYGWRWDDARPPRDRRFARRRAPVDRDKPRRNIEPDPDAALVVKRMHALCSQGKTCAQIAEDNKRTGVRTYKGLDRWAEGTVRKIVLNPTHAGLVRLDGKLVKGRHFEKRLIDPADYYALCRRLASQAKISPRLRRSQNHVFGEFTRCELCGRRMHVQVRPKGARYECLGNDGDVRHENYSVLIERVEMRIVDSIASLAADKTMLDSATEKVAVLIDADNSQAKDGRRRMESELARCEDSLLRWCERFNDSETAPENGDELVFGIYRDKLTADIVSLRSRLAELEYQETGRQARTSQLERAISMLGRFDQIWDGMDLGEKRAFASHIIEDLSFEPDGTRVKVHLKLMLREPETFLVSRRGRDGRGSEGLDSLSVAELTQAYYYMNGCSDADIARERDVCMGTVYGHKKSMIRRAGAATLEEALDLVAPLVEARKNELRIGERRGRHYREHFNESQIDVLKLLAQRLPVREIAERTGRSEKMAYQYIYRLYAKLGVHRAEEALAEAQKRHIIDGPTLWSAHPTDNQLDVLQRLALGESQPKAAKTLGITLSALKTRMRCMFAKFGVSGQDALLDLAQQRRWLR